MAVGDRRDPYNAFRFRLEIDAIDVAAFQECTGFDSSIEIVEHRESTESTTMRKRPGMVKYSNINLKRGITDDRQLFDWHLAAVQGKIERKNVSIILLNDLGEEAFRWNFREAWPAVWKGPALNAEASDKAIEEFELAHEGYLPGKERE